MLDLKKLREKFDLALANETDESLTDWLTKKRGGDINKYNKAEDLENVDEGFTVHPYGIIQTEIMQITSIVIRNINEDDNADPACFYQNAA